MRKAVAFMLCVSLGGLIVLYVVSMLEVSDRNTSGRATFKRSQTNSTSLKDPDLKNMMAFSNFSQKFPGIKEIGSISGQKGGYFQVSFITKKRLYGLRIFKDGKRYTMYANPKSLKKIVSSIRRDKNTKVPVKCRSGYSKAEVWTGPRVVIWNHCYSPAAGIILSKDGLLSLLKKALH